MTIQLPVLLTVRGTLAHGIDQVRQTHNETAGSEAGIANARSLGDLSHKVYAPLTHDSLSTAKEDELLFMDTWVEAGGIMKFFSDERVQQTSTLLFSDRVPTVWMAAEQSFHYGQPAPTGHDEEYVGLVRGPVGDPAKAIATFARGVQAGMTAARRRGLMSHSVWVQMAGPGDDTPPEVLGFERWFSREGMEEHYADSEAMAPLRDVFAGRPDASMWRRAPGQWNEW